MDPMAVTTTFLTRRQVAALLDEPEDAVKAKDNVSLHPVKWKRSSRSAGVRSWRARGRAGSGRAGIGFLADPMQLGVEA
jgi:hypothetical protein